MLNLAGAWHLLLSKLPLRSQTLQLKKAALLAKRTSNSSGRANLERANITSPGFFSWFLCFWPGHWMSLMSLFSGINYSKYPGEISWRSKNIIYRCNELSARARAGTSGQQTIEKKWRKESSYAGIFEPLSRIYESRWPK